MKLAILIIGCVILSSCDASAFTDKMKEFGTKVKDSADRLGDKLKEVFGALHEVATDQVKGLLSQSLQAVAGATIESLKGLKIGKRTFDLPNILNSLVEGAAQLIGNVFDKTSSGLTQVLENLHNYECPADAASELTNVLDSHKVAVRSIIGDTLNSAIDALRNLYYKGKDMLTSALGGGKQKVADPVMVGKRELFEEAWKAISSKVNDLKESVVPQAEKVSEMTENVVAALKHYAGRLWEHVKEQAGDKVQETLGDLTDELQSYLDDAKDVFQSVKKELAEKVLSVIN